MEEILLRKRFKLSASEVYDRINRFLATSELGIDDIRATKLHGGEYHQVRVDLSFHWEDERCIWLATTFPSNSKWGRREQIAGYHEVIELGSGLEAPTEVVVASDWELMKPLFKGLARYLYPPARSPEVFIDNIDSFAQAAKVPPHVVLPALPLPLLEDDVQSFFEQIIGEPFHLEDWGGESADLLTSRLTVDGRLTRAAFLLKGRGTRGKLTIRKRGKNGDQILKLLRAPADIYIIQHVDEIDEAVVSDLREKVQLKLSQGTECSMCIIDGLDTARIFVAYGRLDHEAA